MSDDVTIFVSTEISMMNNANVFEKRLVLKVCGSVRNEAIEELRDMTIGDHN